MKKKTDEAKPNSQWKPDHPYSSLLEPPSYKGERKEKNEYISRGGGEKTPPPG